MRRVVDMIGSFLILYMSAGCNHNAKTENPTIAPAQVPRKKRRFNRQTIR